MKYVDFPKIYEPAINANPEDKQSSAESTNKNSNKPSTTSSPELTNHSFTINGKTHQLLTINEYVLREYVDVFQG